MNKKIIRALLLSAVMGFHAASHSAPAESQVRGFDFAYQVHDGALLGIVQAFDDGERTYFQFANEMSKWPTVWMTDESGKESLAKVEAKIPYLVVRGTGKRFAFKLDKQIGTVEYLGKNLRSSPAIAGPGANRVADAENIRQLRDEPVTPKAQTPAPAPQATAKPVVTQEPVQEIKSDSKQDRRQEMARLSVPPPMSAQSAPEAQVAPVATAQAKTNSTQPAQAAPMAPVVQAKTYQEQQYAPVASEPKDEAQPAWRKAQSLAIPFAGNSFSLSQSVKDQLRDLVGNDVNKQFIVRGRPAEEGDMRLATIRTRSIRDYLVDNLGVPEGNVVSDPRDEVKKGKNDRTISDLVVADRGSNQRTTRARPTDVSGSFSISSNK